MADNIFCRVVQSGNTVEIYRYSTGIPVGFERDCELVKDENTEETDKTEEKRLDNLLRARQNIRRIIWSNQGKYTKFLTLTYADTVLDEKKVKRDITTFVQSMRRAGFDMKYLYVLEHQKDRGEKEGNEGCLHVHMVVFIDKFIPIETIKKCWKHGTFDINKIDNVRNLAAYVSKYITKETVAEFGNRSYSCSINLQRPKEERFYVEGYSDHTQGIIHPNDVIDSLHVTYTKTRRVDVRDPVTGDLRSQVIEYFQGQWKDGDPISAAQSIEEFEREISRISV